MLRVMLAMAVIASVAVMGPETARADEVHASSTPTYTTTTYPEVRYTTTAYPTTTYYTTGATYAAPGHPYSGTYVTYSPSGYYGYSSYNAWYCRCRSGLFGRGGFLGTGLFR